jgi:hypothetical protein
LALKIGLVTWALSALGLPLDVPDRRESRTDFDSTDFAGDHAEGADDPYLIGCVSQLETDRSVWISAMPKDPNARKQWGGAEAPPQVRTRGTLPGLCPWQVIPSLFVTTDRDLVPTPVADFAHEADVEFRRRLQQRGIGCSAHVQVADAVHHVAA